MKKNYQSATVSESLEQKEGNEHEQIHSWIIKPLDYSVIARSAQAQMLDCVICSVDNEHCRLYNESTFYTHTPSATRVGTERRKFSPTVRRKLKNPLRSIEFLQGVEWKVFRLESAKNFHQNSDWSDFQLKVIIKTR